MLEIHRSLAGEQSPLFSAQARRTRDESNIDWLGRAFGEPTGQARLVLLGGRGTEAFRLRVAQSHARQDLTPSHWSHIAVLRGRRIGPGTRLWEIPLEGSRALGFPPATNGVVEGRLKSYADPKAYPNVAAIRVPVDGTEFDRGVRAFRNGRTVLDAVELQVQWLSYLWGTSGAGNPLLAGAGIPSAALVEYAAGAVGFELTPGLASRSSCPEAIWQTAKWWHDYHREENKASASLCISGAWHHGHVLLDP